MYSNAVEFKHKLSELTTKRDDLLKEMRKASVSRCIEISKELSLLQIKMNTLRFKIENIKRGDPMLGFGGDCLSSSPQPSSFSSRKNQ